MGISYLYISKQDAERICRGCDLGDSVRVDAYQFPHVSQLENMLCFMSEAELQKLNKENKKLRELIAFTEGFLMRNNLLTDSWVTRAKKALGEVDR